MRGGGVSPTARSASTANDVRFVWSETEPFDHHGTYFRLEGVVGKPKPWNGGRPLLMSAGSSPGGGALYWPTTIVTFDFGFTAVPAAGS